jgi:hypothetical protein
VEEFVYLIVDRKQGEREERGQGEDSLKNPLSVTYFLQLGLPSL